ncbi:MAG TPA: choice-of-anchor M domain-containing protein [Ilumatobacter sp.]|nr:choice-of-anchor M domain-containing protein [Ilumatobacter sp.]
MGPRFVDGEVSLGWFESDSDVVDQPFTPLGAVVLHLDDDDVSTVPTSAQWRPFGEAGAPWWRTGSSPAGAKVTYTNRQMASYARNGEMGGDASVLTLHGVDGPGAVGISTSATGGLRFNSTTELPQSYAYSVFGPTNMFWGFSEPGYYCIDLEVEAGLLLGPRVTDRAAIAVAVNVDPTHAPLCVPGDSEPVEPTDPVDPADLNDTIEPSPQTPLLFTDGHADVAGNIINGELRLLFRESNQASNPHRYKFDDVVIGIPEYAQYVLPEATDTQDWSLVGPPGSTLWGIPESGLVDRPWVGVSSADIPDRQIAHPISWQLVGVSGIDGGVAPGEFVMWNTPSTNGAGPWFSTRAGLPSSVTIDRAGLSHRHVNWSFTRTGVYCLNFTMATQLADGAHVHDEQVLTVAVGDEAIANTSTTCGRDDIRPTGTHPVDPVEAPRGEQAVIGAFPRQQISWTDIRLRLDESGLDADLVTGRGADAGTAHQFDDAVFSVPLTYTYPITPEPWRSDPGQQVWRIDGGTTLFTGLPYGPSGLDWDLTGIDPGDLTGDIVWSWTDIDGPGDIVLFNTMVDQGWGTDYFLNTRTGHEKADLALWAGLRLTGNTWYFSSDGVYCVDMRWSGATADGTPLVTDKTLTFAVGDVDAAAVDADDCGKTASEINGTDPNPDPDPDPTSGPDRPDSGRTVIGAGHIDLHSTITPGAVQLRVHDDNTEPASFREFDTVTLYASEDAHNAIPVGDNYRFLGEPGDDLWILPQTATEGLLWPGWNLDNTAAPTASGVRFTVNSTTGPGTLSIYQTGSLGGVTVLVDTNDGTPDSFEFTQHGHANWAFSSDGVYCINITMTALPETTPTLSDSDTILFAVGDVDPAKVVPSDCGKTAAEIHNGASSGTPELSQMIVATLDDEAGALVVSVDPNDRDVAMTGRLATGGDRWEADGVLRPVTVIDTRSGAPGWAVSGQVSDFVGAGAGFAGRHLGWSPRVLSQTAGQGAIAGEAMAPGFESGDGLAVSSPLARAMVGLGRGTARLDADLRLELPTTTPPGAYQAVLTLTVI